MNIPLRFIHLVLDVPFEYHRLMVHSMNFILNKKMLLNDDPERIW